MKISESLAGLSDALFTLSCKLLTITMAVAFLLDKVLDINLIKLF